MKKQKTKTKAKIKTKSKTNIKKRKINKPKIHKPEKMTPEQWEKKKQGLVKKAINILEKKKICFFCVIPAFLSCSLKKLYNYKIHEVQEIKDLLEINKIKRKAAMRNNWEKNEAAAALQLSAYKLIGTEEEREILSNKPTINVVQEFKREDIFDVYEISEMEGKTEKKKKNS